MDHFTECDEKDDLWKEGSLGSNVALRSIDLSSRRCCKVRPSLYQREPQPCPPVPSSAFNYLITSLTSASTSPELSLNAVFFLQDMII